MVGNDSAVAFGDLDVFSGSPHTDVWVYSLLCLRHCANVAAPEPFLES
jgi:hypothetical protein